MRQPSLMICWLYPGTTDVLRMPLDAVYPEWKQRPAPLETQVRAALERITNARQRELEDGDVPRARWVERDDQPAVD